MLEKAGFSEYTTLNQAFGIMITKALEEKDHGYARFLAEKMCTLASGFDMGKYNECATMFNVVVAEQNVEAAPGQFGERSNQTFQYTIRYKGRLQQPEEFENIVIKSLPDGEVLRLKDIAEIQLERQG